MIRIRSLAFAVAVMACLPARADVTDIDFGSLAPGGPTTTAFDVGPYVVSLADVDVIGPADPRYAGSVGVAPTDVRWAVEVTPIDPLASIVLSSASFTFASDDDPAVQFIYWTAMDGIATDKGDWPWQTTHEGRVTQTLAVGLPTFQAMVTDGLVAGNSRAGGGQLLSISIDAVVTEDPAQIFLPEPSSALPCLAALAACAWRGRGKSGRSGR